MNLNEPMGPAQCKNCPGMYHWPQHCPNTPEQRQARRAAMHEVVIAEILKREIRLVARPDFEESETWMVKPGNIEHCAKLIVAALHNDSTG